MKYLIGFIGGIFFTTLVFLFLNRNKETPQATPAPPIAETETATIPDDFEDFYNQFHSDSAYQIAHILFPLEGIPPTADSLTLAQGSYRWQQSDWTIHRPFDAMNGEFIRELRRISDEMVVEQIRHNSGQYGMQRRFARFTDGWYLIYYAGMNKLAVEE